jgi:hypothetical protein
MAVGSPTEELLAELIALRTRVDGLEAEREILRVIHSYGPALDGGDEHGWVACFTPDAVWETMGPGAPRTRRLAGARELLEFAQSHTRGPDHQHLHCVFGTRIEVDGDGARAVSYFTRFDGLDEGPVVFAFGRYHDRLDRGRDGWRIAHRRAEIASRGPRKA